MSSVPPAAKVPGNTPRAMLSKVRLCPALTGTIRAMVSRSIPALAAISIPSIEAMKLV